MDFALIMFLLLVVTGSAWLLDYLAFRPKRSASLAFQQIEANLSAQGVVCGLIVGNKEIEVANQEELKLLLTRYDKAASVTVVVQGEKQKSSIPLTKEPIWSEYAKSFFPVILAVFLLRSFLVEPFKIPSGSMIPTLQVGDFILVNKFTYGIRLPIISKKIVQLNDPRRGDVMVFHYPENPSLDYIKRVVGLPGDRIVYRNKKLYLNGVLQEQQQEGEYNYVESGLKFVHAERQSENLDGHGHALLINPEMPDVHLGAVAEFPYRDNCSYTETEMRCTVPDGHYFMLGDNRDNSRDSRYWGFVPDNMIVGKAFLIWMNFGDLKRIGLSIN